ncbi:MAG: sulfite exporter TauE/SafE family protein [Actinomycetota bacterium]|nr:sulfite exporter TauE/SafE family protein [Actinomycetota bacterium]
MTSPPATDRLTGDRLLRAVLVGLGAGFLSGLFGVGGGILMVPALVMVMHLDQRLAHGTSLAAVVPIAVSSTLSYTISGEVDWVVAGFLAVGAIGGAVLGTKLLHSLPEKVLGWAFAALLVATALRLLLDQGDAAGRAPLGVLGAVTLVVTGLASGVLAGLLGVGGGIIMVPVMVVGFDMSAALSKGTSLAVIIPTAVMGTWRNWRKGNVALAVGAVAGLAGVVSAFGAGLISVGMSDSLSNALFAALLILVAVRMCWQLWSERGEPETT